jgi:uncharacterized pyridoxamine 5'-phosphate oxidase family protein
MLDEGAITFLEKNHGAAMTTLGKDGTPHTVRIGLALVDGKIWSSGTQDRLRTKHLRRDPRSTLFVFDNAWAYLGLECRVKILEGADVPDLSVRLFEIMQVEMPGRTPGTLNWYGQEKSHEEFKRLMVEERRIIYEFEVLRTYGLYGAALKR